MWNKRPSLILLVHIKRHKKSGWYIPVALPAVEATLGSWCETLDFWEGLLPEGLTGRLRDQLPGGRKVRLSKLLGSCILMFKELRRHGPYELVSVDNKNEHISIRLW